MSKYFDEMIKSTMDLLSVDSTQATPCELSPFGEGVGKCLKYVENLASKMGFKCHNEQGYYLTCDIGEGDSFGILGHLDVVPFDAKEWTASPYGEIKNDVIYGRGVLDDKGPMMCCLYATYELLKEGFTPSRKIRFLFGGNEETGWKCIDRYNELDTMPKDGFSPDGDFPVINCEKGIGHFEIKLPMPSGMEYAKGGTYANVVMGECEVKVKGYLKIEPTNTMEISYDEGLTILKSYGIEAHGSTPDLGKNASWEILENLAKTIGGEYIFLKDRLCHTDGSGFAANIQDEKSGHITFNLGKIDTCIEDGKKLLRLVLDVRVPVEYTLEYIEMLIKSQFIGAEVSLLHAQKALYVDPNSSLVSKLLKVYNEEMHTNVKPIAIGGGTYARALPNGVAFGPMFPDQESTIHQKDERVSIELLRKTYDIYKKAIKELCF